VIVLPLSKGAVISLAEDGLAFQVRSVTTDPAGGAKAVVAIELASASLLPLLTIRGNFRFLDRYASEEQGGPLADDPDQPAPYSVFQTEWESATVMVLSLNFTPPATVATLSVAIHEKPEPNSAQHDSPSPVVLEVLVSLRSSGATCYISYPANNPAAPPLTDQSS